MTQHEDDAARLEALMLDCAEAYVAQYVERRYGNEVFVHGVMFTKTILPVIRAHLAERDARERMVREAAEVAEKYFSMLLSGLLLFHDRLEEWQKEIHDELRAALSAKNDEQTPTPTEPSQ